MTTICIIFSTLRLSQPGLAGSRRVADLRPATRDPGRNQRPVRPAPRDPVRPGPRTGLNRNHAGACRQARPYRNSENNTDSVPLTPTPSQQLRLHRINSDSVPVTPESVPSVASSAEVKGPSLAPTRARKDIYKDGDSAAARPGASAKPPCHRARARSWQSHLKGQMGCCLSGVLQLRCLLLK